MRKSLFIVLGTAGFLLSGCGGSPTASTVPADAAQRSDETAAPPKTETGIAIVRRSFEAMGGLERLRLIGGRLSIKSTALTAGNSFPIEITLAGSERWQIHYVKDNVRYIYNRENCYKVVYDIPAQCTPAEKVWMDPTRILIGLLFPGGDAANLKANFRAMGRETSRDELCDVVEIRPQNANLIVRAFYSRQTKLPVQLEFSLKNGPKGGPVKWTMLTGDWREVSGVRFPFSRSILLSDKLVWTGLAGAITLEPNAELAFAPPLPPTTNQPMMGSVPARRVIQATVAGVALEIPAPYPTVGGGPNIEGKAIYLPGVDRAIRLIAKKPLTAVDELKTTLGQHPALAGKTGTDNMRVILLENPLSPKTPVMMMIYRPLD